MHLLMCPPNYFDVSYEINPWMRLEVTPDRSVAQRQWETLYKIVTEQIGAQVSLIDPQPGLPDMVFTANAGLVEGQTYIPARFKYQEREGEVVHFRNWYAARGYREQELTSGPFEGEGDALWYAGTLLAGYGPRSSEETHPQLERILGRKVLSLGLVDGRYYHLDVCFAPLGPNELAYYAPAFDEPANRALEALPGNKIKLTKTDADCFGANVIVLGRDVVMNVGAVDLASALTSSGYRVHTTDLSEFLKAGGSAKCLALTLER